MTGVSTRRGKGIIETQGRSGGDEDRDWSHAATSQATPGSCRGKEGSSFEPSEVA